MSVCLNGIWQGAALEYCREDESFISPRWAQRHNLELTDGQIRLTWKFDGDDKTHLTQFILLNNLEPDFMLGVKSADELFNRDCGASRSPGLSHSMYSPRNVKFSEAVLTVSLRFYGFLRAPIGKYDDAGLGQS